MVLLRYPMDHTDFTLTDLISLERLQRIQDAFATANRVASNIVDIEGTPITKLSNDCKLCHLIRTTKEGRNRCRMSVKRIGNLAHEKKHVVKIKCDGIGFADAAAPIVIEGRHIANWIMGQYNIMDVDEQRIRGYAAEIGLDPESMIEEFRKMPKLSSAEFDSKLHFLEIMANELSEQGYLYLKQKQQTAKLADAKQSLEKHKALLERTVEERTISLRRSNRELKEQVRQKDRVQHQQRQLITAIESTVDSIIITDAEGEIQYVNPAFEKLTGYGKDEVRGKTPRLLKSGQHDEQFYVQLWQSLKSGKTWSGEFCNMKKDGSIYKEAATISPVHDENGRIVNFVAVKRDITQDVRLQEQFRRSQKMESIGTLAAGVAHEVNTPLQYVLSNTLFLQEAFADLNRLVDLTKKIISRDQPTADSAISIESGRKIAEDIDLEYLMGEIPRAIDQNLEGLEKVSSIVKALKDFSSPGTKIKENEDLRKLIDTTLAVSKSYWGTVASMKFICPESFPLVPLYVSEFRQVLLDMMINAVDAVVEKFGNESHQKGRITLSLAAKDTTVELRLSDNGSGISKSHLNQIFDPFFTTKPLGKGRGNALSMAYSVISEMHSGSITVDSEPGRGTEFLIRLPLS